MNIFDHDNGVVDDEADRDRQRHQRQIVDREARDPHRGAGADQRERHGDAGGDDGRRAAQKHIDDHHHQKDGDRQRPLNVVNAGANGLGAVGKHIDLDAARNPLLKLRHHRFDLIDRFDHIGVWLLGDDKKNGRLAVEPAGGVAVFDAELDRGDVAELDHRPAARCDDDVAIVFGRRQLIGRRERDLPRIAAERPYGGMGVGGVERVGDGVDAEPHGGETRAIDLDADRRLLGAREARLGDARDLRNPLRDHGIGRIENRARRQCVGGHRQHEHGHARLARLSIDGRHRQIRRQVGDGGVDRRLNVARRRVQRP